MALSDTCKANFETLKQAFGDENVALLECKDAKTGEYVAVICAVHKEDEEYVFTPFARMFIGNPYEELEPPEELKDESPVQSVQPSRA